jgi:hypothetical protein
MKFALAIVLVAGLAPAALATTYSLDDGTAENSVGLNNGGVLAGINAFPVAGSDNVITAVEVAWGTPLFVGTTGVVAGTPFNYYVWSANGTGSNPSGAGSTLLFSGSSTISAANIENNTFQSLAVPSVVIGSAIFYVGVSISHAAGAFPIAVDQSAPTLSGVSWVAGGAAFDPNNVGFASGGAIDLAASGLGNLMIRATAVPAPSALGLLGLGGLVAGRRRR